MSTETILSADEESLSTETILPAVEGPRKVSTAWCAIAFEELAEAINFIDLGSRDMTPMQREVWERYKQQTVDFAHDMLLAEGDKQEIARRLGI